MHYFTFFSTRHKCAYTAAYTHTLGPLFSFSALLFSCKHAPHSSPRSTVGQWWPSVSVFIILQGDSGSSFPALRASLLGVPRTRRRRQPGSEARVTGQETRQFLPLPNKSNVAFPDINDMSFINMNTDHHRLIQQNTSLEYEKPKLYHANTSRSTGPFASLRLS